MNAELRRLAAAQRAAILRGVVSRVDDTKKAQQVQITTREAEAPTVEHFQGFGLSGVPPVGTEVIVVQLAGAMGAEVAIATESRAHRPKGNNPGDAVLYDAHGHQIRLTEAGIALGEGASLGVARTTDATVSTSAEDATFWAWLFGLVTTLTTWVPVANDGGAALKAAVSAYIGANPTPASLTGKITGGSSVVKAVD